MDILDRPNLKDLLVSTKCFREQMSHGCLGQNQMPYKVKRNLFFPSPITFRVSIYPQGFPLGKFDLKVQRGTWKFFKFFTKIE